jgi:ribose 1,5-bisphosphokinase PhnN
MTETSKIARKNLIAEIAKRHAAEREFVKSVSVKESTGTAEEYDAVIAEEFERLEKASVILG